MGGKNDNKRVASPESVRIHLNTINTCTRNCQKEVRNHKVFMSGNRGSFDKLLGYPISWTAAWLVFLRPFR